jgi:hypothetical protein
VVDGCRILIQEIRSNSTQLILLIFQQYIQDLERSFCVKLPHVQVRSYVEPRSESGEKLADDTLLGCGRRRGGQRKSAHVV